MAIPANQANTLTEYAAVRDGGAGLLDLSQRGRILIGGSEAVTFLNGLITNDMKTLDSNRWMPAAFPNVQGRLIAAIRVIHNDDGFLIDTESVTRDSVLKLVERFTLAGDFRVANLTDEMSLLSIQGAKAPAVVGAVLRGMTADPDYYSVATVDWQGERLTIIRATHTGEDGFDLFVPKSRAEALRTALVSAGAQAVGFDALETLRIEAGIPRYGIDMDETNVVTETNLDEGVSFTKGCYIGQEIIARIKYRGHVAKKLTGLVFDGEVALEGGAKILSTDDKEIGRVTSSAFSPRLNGTIALGYVKYDYLKPGTSVNVHDAGHEQHTARVTELPFVSGSPRPTPHG
jgi:folate-binding protein YgfZ